MSTGMKIIYIAGYERSGTTIIHNIISQQEGFFGIGESRDIWLRGFKENRLCGCSNKFADCSFWSDILDIFTKKEIESIFKQRQKLRNRHLYKIFFPNMFFRTYYKNYLRGLSTLFKWVYKKSGDSYIVDSSKSPLYGLLLNIALRNTVSILHVVRDPRATNLSMKERKMKSNLFKNYNSLKGVFDWIILNLLTRLMAFKNIPYLQITYEGFCSNPQKVLKEVNKFYGHVSNELLIKEDKIELKATHTVSGSGKRFNTGYIKIKDSKAWKNESSINTRIVGLITYPFRLIFYRKSSTI